MGNIIKRERPPATIEDIIPSSPIDANGLTNEESNELSIALSKLNPTQLRAAMLEASGTSRTLISEQLGVSVGTICGWHSNNEAYQKIISINSSVLERQGRDFRIKQVKQIIAPAYVELMRRTSDPAIMRNMETRDVLDLITKMSKEIRSDLTVTGEGVVSEDSEITDLQKRRTAIAAIKNKAIDDIKNDTNIIQFPKRLAVNS